MFLYVRRLALAGVALLSLSAAAPAAPSPASPSSTSSPAVARYLEVRAASAPAISPDGTRVAYLSNMSGTFQIWLIDTKGGPPRQLTSFDDKVGFVSWSPDGRTLAFGKDEKGNERTQIHLLDVASGKVTAVTQNPKAIHTFGGWSPDGKRLAWASNARNVAFFDAYVYDVAAGQSRCVRQTDETCVVAGWAGSDAVVVRRENTNLDADLLLQPVNGGDARLLTPHKGEAEYASVNVPKGQQTLYCVTNQDREHAGLAAIDLQTGVFRWLTSQERWSVSDLVMSRDGARAAVVRNENGASVLRLCEANDLAHGRAVSLPLGVLTGLSFSESGAGAAFGLTAPRQPASVWRLDTATGKSVALVTPALNGIAPDTLVEPSRVTFPTFDGRSIPALFYRPRGEGRHPVIISVHGGPEAQERPVWNGLYQYFTSRGYAVLAPNIRGSLGYGKTYTHLDDARLRGDAIEDVARAVAWLRAQPDVNGEKIAVMGGSYGGYMTLAQVAFHPELYAAAVDIVGISNFETFLANTGPWRRKLRIAEYGDPDKDREALRRFSPIHKVADIRAPLMVIQGANDPRVPKSEADQMVASLRGLNRTVVYLVFDDEGHGLAKLPNRIKAYTEVSRFFDTWLKGTSND